MRRMTTQRKIILEELRAVKSHPTADELFGIVKKKLPNISLGTVYRNLETLSAKGIIRKLDSGGLPMRFDGRVEEHCHVRCERCGKLGDLALEPDVRLCETVGRLSGYSITGYTLIFCGICRECSDSGGNG